MTASKSPIVYFFIAVILMACAAGTPDLLHAQDTNQYFLANRLFQQQKFEKAYPLFKKLHETDPGTYVYFERATRCLINLERYEEAITFTNRALQQTAYPTRMNIRLGEIYHIKGETGQAKQIWDALIADRSQPLQVYINLAATLRERREFERAIELYKDVAQRFPATDLLITEQADTYMQAGDYEEAIRSYLSLLKDSPNKINYVQTRIFRLRDDRLYDAAILEIGDFLDELTGNHASKNTLQQLQLWLLLERGLAERALATARRYEKQNSRPSYLLYSLASRLLATEEFKLAEKAYNHYINSDNRSLRLQSMEQLAGVYIRWGDYLRDYNLAFSYKRDSLYQQAYRTLQSLTEQAPDYPQLNRVLVSRAELALDYLHNAGHAHRFTRQLQSRNDSAFTAKRLYLQGRINLYEGDYGRARIQFSSSNKRERIGSLAEKTRYYLALTDFYAGDYEFADIQLNALERQKTSYFANDAVKLRIWIQQGLQADSTGRQLQPYARAVEQYARGNVEKGFTTLAVMMDSSRSHPLKEEALLEMSTHLTPALIAPAYARLGKHLTDATSGSPLHERLLWERARIADQYFSQPVEEVQAQNRAALPASVDEILPLYETILLNYPQGFYASYVRERLQQLQQKPL